jgi:hypothetical protein
MLVYKHVKWVNRSVFCLAKRNFKLENRRKKPRDASVPEINGYEHDGVGAFSRFGDSLSNKTITRSFRLAANLDDLIISAAAKRRITPSALLNQILRSYFGWYQFASGDGSPFVMVVDQFLIGMLDSMDDAAVVEMTNKVALPSLLDFVKFRWQKVDLQSALAFVELMSSNMNVGTFGVVRSPDTVEIRVRHSLGSKWSLFLGELIAGIFNSMPGTQATSTASKIGCSIEVLTPKM